MDIESKVRLRRNVSKRKLDLPLTGKMMVNLARKDPIKDPVRKFDQMVIVRLTRVLSMPTKKKRRGVKKEKRK